MLAISPAQIDRLLAPRKVRVGHRGRCGTKPGGLLQTQIPIRTDNWDITRPGFLEADTVAHCGGSLEGDFIYCDILRLHDRLIDLDQTLTVLLNGKTAFAGKVPRQADAILKSLRLRADSHSVATALPEVRQK